MSKEQKTINRERSEGFTIAELLIATTIFSMILLVILASFMQVGRMFYKGISVNNTNDATRNLVDVVAANVRQGSDPKDIKTDTANGPNGPQYFCVGSHRYTARTGVKVGADQIASPNATTIVAGVIEDNIPACAAPSAVSGANARQLLGPDMQLNSINFNCNNSGNCTIQAHVVFYGADDSVLTPSANDPTAQCSGNLLSSQFCAVSDISTNVTMGY